MTHHRMFDAAFPPSRAPEGFEVAAGYIGGDTPHVWTKAEWARFSSLAKLPIFVHADKSDATTDAWTALFKLYELRVPPHSRIVLDLETRIDPAYVTTFYRIVNFFGYLVWPYGSTSTLFNNPPCNGYWVADPTVPAVPHFYKSSRPVRATQYEEEANHGEYDASVVRRYQVRHMWH